MNRIMQIIEDHKDKKCSCGIVHETAIKDVQLGSGIVKDVGEILKKNNFSTNLLVVADRNTLKASEGIKEALRDFKVTYHIYDDLRVATIEVVEEIEALIKDKDIAVLSVGTGSLNDPCRLACARQNKMFAIFATAPSMDGFASYGAPIVKGSFKSTYPAKSPDVIIADTKILAAAPGELKASGFGDMVAKYVALIDWKISSLLINEYWCDDVAAITREAIDQLMGMADRVQVNDEETAGRIFEALLMTGIGMSYTKTSRPASGCEHMIAHLMECKEIQDGIVPDFHGVDVGVCTLEMLKYYNELAKIESIDTRLEKVDWDDVYKWFGPMADDVKKLNEPTITEKVDPKLLKELWPEIREIIKSVPDYETCKEAMIKAGCKITIEDIGKTQKFYDDCLKYSPFMRYRLTLLRMKDMIIN